MLQIKPPHARLSWLSKGRANGPKPDIRKRNLSITVVALHIRRLAGISRALAARHTGNARVLVGREVAVEPQHAGVIVGPQTHHEYHAFRGSLAHRCHAAVLIEWVGVFLEHLLLCVAPLLRDAVAFHTLDSGLGVGDHFSVLDVEALELLQIGTGPDELRDDGELLRRVNRLAFAVEVFDSDTERVEVAAVGIYLLSNDECDGPTQHVHIPQFPAYRSFEYVPPQLSVSQTE